MAGHRPGRYVVDLDDVDRHDVALVGAKGANLGELRRAGFRVPDGFVVTVHADLVDEEEVASGSVERDVRDAYDRLQSGSGAPRAVAVRSSGVDEDDADGSHAGMFDTFLHVVGVDAVLARIGDCRASVGSDRAAAYRGSQGRSGRSAMAVVVQLMAPTHRSGVAFSVDPIGADPASVLIEATDAAIGAVVDGSVSPDAYRVDRTGSVAVRPGTAGGRGVLSEVEAVALAGLTRRIESHFGCPQDVEWTLGPDGTAWVVQARPITTLPPTDAPAVLVEAEAVPRELGAPIVTGVGASPGRTVGTVRVLRSADDGWDLVDGEILVAPTTSPAWVPAMLRAAAIVTDTGGVTSHAAIVARELGVACVVGTRTATADLRDGDVVAVDGSAGTIHRLR